MTKEEDERYERYKKFWIEVDNLFVEHTRKILREWKDIEEDPKPIIVEEKK